jgi:hypothetical protein
MDSEAMLLTLLSSFITFFIRAMGKAEVADIADRISIFKKKVKIRTRFENGFE